MNIELRQYIVDYFFIGCIISGILICVSRLLQKNVGGNMKKFIYVTKYALTSGIDKRELLFEEDGYAVILNRNGDFVHLAPTHYSWDLVAAKLQVEKMKELRLQYLKNEIIRLENMSKDMVLNIESSNDIN